MDTERETGASLEKLTSYPVHSKSPFMSGLVIPSGRKVVQIAKEQDMVLMNNKTGEESSLFIATRQKVDKEEFRKIFTSALRETFKLKQPGYRMFCYFMDAAKINDDRVLLILDDALDYTKYTSRKSIYIGIAELLKHNFIARTTTTNIYFINPSIFFNGNRLNLIKSYYTNGETPEVEIRKSNKELPF